jgi:hypothetical protein
LDKVAAEAGEVIDAIAKIFAEPTSRQDAPIRQQLIEELTPNLVELRSGCVQLSGNGTLSSTPERR